MGGYTGIIGPLLLSIFVNTYASGLVGVQYALFQSLKYKKSLTIRLTVLGMYIIDVFQIAIAFYMIWLYCVTNYVDPTALNTIAVWVFTTIPLCSAFSSFIAHIFMTHRVSLLSEKRVVVAALGISSTAVFILGLVAGSYGIAHNISVMDVVTGASSYRMLLVALFVVRLVVDIQMLGTLGYTYTRQDPAYLDHIDLPILRIILIAIQCGCVTTTFSLCTLITFLASPKTTLYLVFLLPSGRLYSSTLLTTINSIHRGEDTQTPSGTVTKDMWAVHRTTRNSFGQSISLHPIRAEQEDVIDISGAQSGGDARSISSHISDTDNPTRDHKKSARLLLENDRT